MRIEDGRLVLERRECRQCWGRGTVATKARCPKCRGTGKGPRGGRNGCRDCHGFGTAYDQDQRVTCPTCDGHPEGFEGETRYDSAPEGMLDTIPVVAYVRESSLNLAETMLGHGTIYR